LFDDSIASSSPEVSSSKPWEENALAPFDRNALSRAGKISFAFGIESAYDFRKVERGFGLSVQFPGVIGKKYLLLLGLSVSGMILFAVFGGRGLMQIYQLKEESNRIQVTNARLQEENRKLTEKINLLRNNKEEVEKVAREELGLVKKGEIIYQFEK
jgi:cell division protein FtsB